MKVKIREHFSAKQPVLEPKLFKMLMKIMDAIPQPADSLTNDEFITYLVTQIKETSDRLETPIFREGGNFYLYQDEKQIYIPNKGMEEFLGWTCKHLGLDEAIAYYIPFRNSLFGACWRELAPEV